MMDAANYFHVGAFYTFYDMWQGGSKTMMQSGGDAAGAWMSPTKLLLRASVLGPVHAATERAYAPKWATSALLSALFFAGYVMKELEGRCKKKPGLMVLRAGKMLG